MKSLILFDTSIGTTNQGDHIIMDAVRRVTYELFPNHYVISLPTHLFGGWKARRMIKAAELSIVGGTNLLSSNMALYRQWKISLVDALNMGNAVLLGVGWWQYQRPPSPFTALLLKASLDTRRWHSVRDGYTERQLLHAGISNAINTACPTLWHIDVQKLSRKSQIKPDTVVATVTFYNRNEERDRALLNSLRSLYGTRYFWPQGLHDHDYATRALGLDGFHVLPPTLTSFDEILSEGADYIGTRLHAGIRAMQKGQYARILPVDNRAREMARDFGIPLLEGTTMEDVTRAACNDRSVALFVPHTRITEWKKKLFL